MLHHSRRLIAGHLCGCVVVEVLTVHDDLQEIKERNFVVKNDEFQDQGSRPEIVQLKIHFGQLAARFILIFRHQSLTTKNEKL